LQQARETLDSVEKSYILGVHSLLLKERRAYELAALINAMFEPGSLIDNHPFQALAETAA